MYTYIYIIAGDYVSKIVNSNRIFCNITFSRFDGVHNHHEPLILSWTILETSLTKWGSLQISRIESHFITPSLGPMLRWVEGDWLWVSWQYYALSRFAKEELVEMWSNSTWSPWKWVVARGGVRNPWKDEYKNKRKMKQTKTRKEYERVSIFSFCSAWLQVPFSVLTLPSQNWLKKKYCKSWILFPKMKMKLCLST